MKTEYHKLYVTAVIAIAAIMSEKRQNKFNAFLTQKTKKLGFFFMYLFK
jgi:hypothetical protein